MPLGQLPTEVLRCIVDWLDPADDTATLLSLMRVSNSCWDAAARRLYTSIALDRDQVVLLIAGPHWRAPLIDAPRCGSSGHNLLTLSDRTRRALSFVRRLRIVGHWSRDVVEMLWAAAAGRGSPLFPNVVHLFLDIGLPSHASYVPYSRSDHPDLSDLFIFDTIDVCVLGDENRELLFVLPAKRYRSITCHEVLPCRRLSSAWECDDSPQWESWRCFLSDAWEAVHTMGEDLAKLTRNDNEEDRTPPFRLPPLQLCLNYGVTLGRDVVTHFENQYHEHHHEQRMRIFSSLSHVLRIHHYPPNGEGCPPCELCGKTWRSQELVENRQQRAVGPTLAFLDSLPRRSLSEELDSPTSDRSFSEETGSSNSSESSGSDGNLDFSGSSSSEASGSSSGGSQGEESGSSSPRRSLKGESSMSSPGGRSSGDSHDDSSAGTDEESAVGHQNSSEESPETSPGSSVVEASSLELNEESSELSPQSSANSDGDSEDPSETSVERLQAEFSEMSCLP